ncbi:hypothetical protein A3715_18135 [Oleiphilus sp. HI0009]|nr:hypothetical protein A3715_18135 [Oleiphilus sp. HI0009]
MASSNNYLYTQSLHQLISEAIDTELYTDYENLAFELGFSSESSLFDFYDAVISSPDQDYLIPSEVRHCVSIFVARYKDSLPSAQALNTRTSFSRAH